MRLGRERSGKDQAGDRKQWQGEEHDQGQLDGRATSMITTTPTSVRGAGRRASTTPVLIKLVEAAFDRRYVIREIRNPRAGCA